LIRFPTAALLLAVLLAGCLPSSQRASTRAVTPADSLSMRLAAEAPVDTLRLVWTADAPEASPFALPTSLAWLPDSLGGHLVVADTRRGSLHVVSPEGAYVEERRPEGLRYPYLAGLRADTVVVHSRGARRLDFVLDDRVVRRLGLPADYSAVLATDSLLWAKRTEEGDAYLARLDNAGREVARYRLPGPYWRHTGFLRPWGGALLSLSGYRPVVDRLRAGAPEGAALDTLSLRGFDSPQLVRSYQFMLGEIDEPPLLTSAAAALGDRLFVLNLRVDAVRVDVYGRTEGGVRLERVLVYPDAALVASGFPADLAVREGPDGVRFALVLQDPGGGLRRSSGRVAMLAWDGALHSTRSNTTSS
jgi:hypothetical protein